ncbi:MAG TPA: type I glyceraldehyde-3-phosphate dehydrogenase [Ktedonobacteraceae bacterium]|nr:type I glyceraldehyde-3-phosphate dehydrogenase [Ktedonobacteraceae bacterium]
MKIGINGFGRIGRLVLRSALARGIELDVVAINDRGEAAINAHLFQFDSTYGPFPGRVEVEDDQIIIDGRAIAIVSHLNPLDIPWRELGVELVIEATGMFTPASQAAAHLLAGAERVLVTAPSKGADVTIVVGVNERKYDPAIHQIISAASCTTNALALLASVLHERFGLCYGMMNTIHAYTNDQRILDRSHNDPRRARAGAENIIPTTTGATKALGEVIPALAGKFHGISYRVPTITVSVIDLVAKLEHTASVGEINAAFTHAANEPLAGILGYTDLPLVSSDFRGDSRSSIVDGLMTAELSERNMIHIVGWYDNEWGYASRVADLANFISECEQSGKRLDRVRVVERENIERALRLVSFASEELLP